MTKPQPEKLLYYEDYYKKVGNLAHDILINEDNQLCDGYISYLLAQKYRLHPDIYQVLNGQPYRKVVCGRHVKFEEGEWRIKSDKFYNWIYTLKEPVVPGDILQVETSQGLAYMLVEKVGYLTGKEFCNEHKKVREHILCYHENTLYPK